MRLIYYFTEKFNIFASLCCVYRGPDNCMRSEVLTVEASDAIMITSQNYSQQVFPEKRRSCNVVIVDQ